jgi:putative membrane protein
MGTRYKSFWEGRVNFSEFNKNARLLTLACICIGIYSALASGTILLFLHPRSLFLVKIAWVILVILTLSDLRTFGKSKDAVKFNWRFFVLFFPLVLFLYVKPGALSSRLAVQKGLSSLALTAQSDTNAINYDTTYGAENIYTDSNVTTNNNTHDTLTKGVYDIKVGDVITEPGIIQKARPTDTIKDDSMYVKLDRIYKNPAQYKGRSVAMTGFIAHDTVIGRRSFFLGRMMVTCCAADAMPIGFYCVTDTELGVNENEWAVLTGTLEPRSVKFPWDNDRRTIPLLKVKNVKKTHTPGNEYVYPISY